jgi:hypothetical protein
MTFDEIASGGIKLSGLSLNSYSIVSIGGIKIGASFFNLLIPVPSCDVRLACICGPSSSQGAGLTIGSNTTVAMPYTDGDSLFAFYPLGEQRGQDISGYESNGIETGIFELSNDGA